MSSPVLASNAANLRPLVEAFIPAAGGLDETRLLELLRRADTTLAGRPPSLRAQVRLAVRALSVLVALRFFRPMARVPADRLRAFLLQLQDAPVIRVRQAVWGLRTLVFAGYYGDPRVQAEIGYQPRPDGWSAVAEVSDEAD